MSDLLKEIERDMERGQQEREAPTPTPTPTERGIRDYKPTDRPLYMSDQPFHTPKPLKHSSLALIAKLRRENGAPEPPETTSAAHPACTFKPLKTPGLGTQPKPYVPAPTSWAYVPGSTATPAVHGIQLTSPELRAEYEAAAAYDEQLKAAAEFAKFEAIPDPNEERVLEIEERIRAEKYGPQVSKGKYESD